MLRFFRINDPYRLAVIFVLLVIFRFILSYAMGGQSYYGLKWVLLGEWLNQGFVMYAQTFDYTGPLAALIYKYTYFIFGRSSFIYYGFSTLIIIFQAGIFNQLLLKNKAYDENSYLPAFLYMVLMVSIPDFMTLSPQLLSLTFVLLGLRNVLRRIDNQVTDELFLNTGIFIGIASMIYLPSLVFFLVFLFSLILFSTAVTRRLLLYLFSFLLVFIMCALYFYWRDHLQVFLDSYLIQNLLLNFESKLSLHTMLIACAGFILVFVLSVLKTWGSARLTNFQQKIQQVIWLVFFGGVTTFFLSNEKSLHELVFVVPAIAYFWTHYFMLIRRKLFKLAMPGLLIFGLMGYTAYFYCNWAGPLMVKEKEGDHGNKKTMVLGEDLSYYASQKILTPCFNNQMSIHAFEGLDYYHSAVALYQLFSQANPQFIVDEIEVMPRVFSRFPQLKKDYRKIGKGRYQKISN